MDEGRPCIATDVGAIAEAVGTDAVVLPPDDAPALTDALARLLADRHCRVALGAQAHRRAVRQFDARLMTARTTPRSPGCRPRPQRHRSGADFLPERRRMKVLERKGGDMAGLEWFLACLLVIGLILAALVVSSGVLLGRRAYRRVSGVGTELTERTSQWARAVADPSFAQVSRLRRRLYSELRAMEDVLLEAGDGRVFTADGRTVLARLKESAAELDSELRAVADYLDPDRRAAATAVLKPQVEQLVAATYSARQTILETAAQDRSRRLDGLSADIQREADALARYRNSSGGLSL
jgi:hypothetical protein